MPAVSLPILSSSSADSGGAHGAANAAIASGVAIDRSKPYASCAWLERGLAFNRRSLNACLIVHHGRGFPHLCDYNGGPVDVPAALAARARIIAENQAGGHEACRGCPHLVTRRWPTPRQPISLVAIAQFARCNIACNYCYLQTQPRSLFEAGFDPYPVLPALRQLADAGVLSPSSTFDWGGGEPTIYREFDQTLEFVTRRGGRTWIHTNGTRLPAPIERGLSTKRIHVLCSVDAGTRETWLRMKGRDLLDTVWRNLDRYVRLGCGVVLKYIVTEDNCDEAEIRAFVERAVSSGARELIVDIDYDSPRPTPAVVAGVRTLMHLATTRGMYVTFGSTGANFTPEADAGGKVRQRGWTGSPLGAVAYWLKHRRAKGARIARAVRRKVRFR